MKIWLIGTGPMAVDYAKVLQGLNQSFTVIGRAPERAKDFEAKTGVKALSGGLDKFLSGQAGPADFVINAVGIDALQSTTLSLLKHGVKNILLEKPGIAYADEIDELANEAKKQNAQVLLAYNRRFYQSVLAAEKMIAEDGGIKSFNFEFTEWSHQIEALAPSKTQAELQNWFLGNSTHVIDLAFFLGGDPTEMCAYVSGKNEISWHHTSGNFSGAGISDKGALFAYHANWRAPGRFSVEMLTSKKRYIFRPLEKLQVQNIGSVAINMAEGIDYSLDEQYKPGLFLQTKAFFEKDRSRFIDIQGQQKMIRDYYRRMSGY